MNRCPPQPPLQGQLKCPTFFAHVAFCAESDAPFKKSRLHQALHYYDQNHMLQKLGLGARVRHTVRHKRDYLSLFSVEEPINKGVVD